MPVRAHQLDEQMAAMGRLRQDIARMVDDLPAPGDDGWRCASALQINVTRDERE